MIAFLCGLIIGIVIAFAVASIDDEADQEEFYDDDDDIEE